MPNDTGTRVPTDGPTTGGPLPGDLTTVEPSIGLGWNVTEKSQPLAMEFGFCEAGTDDTVPLIPLPPITAGAKTRVGPVYRLLLDGTYDTVPPTPKKLPNIPPRNAPGGPPVHSPISAPAAMVGPFVVTFPVMIEVVPEEAVQFPLFVIVCVVEFFASAAGNLSISR